MTLMNDDLDLEDCWRDLTPVNVPPPRVSQIVPKVNGQRVQSWVADLLDEDEKRVISVQHPSFQTRLGTYGLAVSTPGLHVVGQTPQPNDWLQLGLFKAFEKRIANLSSTPWQWLTDLVSRPFFLVEEPLRSMLDANTSPMTGLFATLWEARLSIQEGASPRALLAAATRWIAGTASDIDLWALTTTQLMRELEDDEERIEMLLFLATLARQNGLFDRTIVAFDGLDQAASFSNTKRRQLLKPMTDFCGQVERWGHLGSGVGVMLGFSDRGAIEATSPALSRRVRLALV